MGAGAAEWEVGTYLVGGGSGPHSWLLSLASLALQEVGGLTCDALLVSLLVCLSPAFLVAHFPLPLPSFLVSSRLVSTSTSTSCLPLLLLWYGSLAFTLIASCPRRPSFWWPSPRPSLAYLVRLRLASFSPAPLLSGRSVLIHARLCLFALLRACVDCCWLVCVRLHSFALIHARLPRLHSFALICLVCARLRSSALICTSWCSTCDLLLLIISTELLTLFLFDPHMLDWF